jgi:hypothetical protein
MSLSQLRPLGFGEILDGAFTLYRRHFRSLLLTSLLPITPLLAFWLALPLFARGSVAAVDRAYLISSWAVYVLGFPLWIVAWGALVQQLSNAYLGGEVSLVDGFSVTRGVLGRLLVMYAVYYAALVVGLVLLIVPAVVVTVVFFAKLQAVVLERRSPMDALRRSRALAKGGGRQVLGVVGVLYIMQYLVQFAISGVGRFIVPFDPAFGMPHGGWFRSLFMVANTLAACFLLPLFLAATTLLYYDRRVRTEALDLQPAPEPAYA